MQKASIWQKIAIRWAMEAPCEAGWIRGGISPAYGRLWLLQGLAFSQTHVVLPTPRGRSRVDLPSHACRVA